MRKCELSTGRWQGSGVFVFSREVCVFWEPEEKGQAGGGPGGSVPGPESGLMAGGDACL